MIDIPVRIWAYHGTGFEGQDIIAADTNPDPWADGGVGCVEFVRADVAAGLARALEEISGMDIMSCSAIAYNALTAYREASK